MKWVLKQNLQDKFYKSLPKEAKLSNNQIQEAKQIQSQCEAIPNMELTSKEKNLLDRFEKFKQHKDDFYKNNP